MHNREINMIFKPMGRKKVKEKLNNLEKKWKQNLWDTPKVVITGNVLAIMLTFKKEETMPGTSGSLL
jgi:hypothetical protein